MGSDMEDGFLPLCWMFIMSSRRIPSSSDRENAHLSGVPRFGCWGAVAASAASGPSSPNSVLRSMAVCNSIAPLLWPKNRRSLFSRDKRFRLATIERWAASSSGSTLGMISSPPRGVDAATKELGEAGLSAVSRGVGGHSCSTLQVRAL